jgi:hypothetical protein
VLGHERQTALAPEAVLAGKDFLFGQVGFAEGRPTLSGGG